MRGRPLAGSPAAWDWGRAGPPAAVESQCSRVWVARSLRLASFTGSQLLGSTRPCALLPPCEVADSRAATSDPADLCLGLLSALWREGSSTANSSTLSKGGCLPLLQFASEAGPVLASPLLSSSRQEDRSAGTQGAHQAFPSLLGVRGVNKASTRLEFSYPVRPNLFVEKRMGVPKQRLLFAYHSHTFPGRCLKSWDFYPPPPRSYPGIR